VGVERKKRKIFLFFSIFFSKNKNIFIFFYTQNEKIRIFFFRSKSQIPHRQRSYNSANYLYSKFGVKQTTLKLPENKKNEENWKSWVHILFFSPRIFYFRVISKSSDFLQTWNISSSRYYKTFVGGEFEISTLKKRYEFFQFECKKNKNIFIFFKKK